jgi:hypothetical protein
LFGLVHLFKTIGHVVSESRAPSPSDPRVEPSDYSEWYRILTEPFIGNMINQAEQDLLQLHSPESADLHTVEAALERATSRTRSATTGLRWARTYEYYRYRKNVINQTSLQTWMLDKFVFTVSLIILQFIYLRNK